SLGAGGGEECEGGARDAGGLQYLSPGQCACVVRHMDTSFLKIGKTKPRASTPAALALPVCRVFAVSGSLIAGQFPPHLGSWRQPWWLPIPGSAGCEVRSGIRGGLRWRLRRHPDRVVS